MGLDMYLSAKRYVSQYDEADQELAKVIKAEQVKGMGEMRLSHLVCEAAYWRKANHIHRWFVNNVQEGNDDCGSYYVGVEQLRTLLNLCETVLADHSKAQELLPVQDGFFFGSTDYDEGYFGDVQHTVDAIKQVLATEGIEHWTFEYQSSW